MNTSDIAEYRPKLAERDHVIAQAAAFIVRWGSIDGDHHKQWVLDQVLRILMGTAYGEFIALIANWSEGIPP